MSSSEKKSAPVAFVLKGYPRVSETFIAQEIYLLEQLGFDITIFSMRGAREKERQPLIEKIKARVVYLPEYIFKEPGTILKYNFLALLDFPLNYIKFFLISLFRVIKSKDDDPLKRFLQAGWLVGKESLGKNSKIKHLHSHFIHAPTEMTFYISRITGLPYSISAHAKDIYTIPQDDLIERVNASKLLMTCTRFNVEHLKSIPGLHADKVKLAYHGIDLETFQPARDVGHDDIKMKRLISVGRLVEKKGYDVILKALSLLKKSGHDFSYDIIGSGEDYEKLRTLTQSLDLQSTVTFHKTLIQPQVTRMLESSGLFIMGSKVTSEGDRDGIPNTLAEAMSMELPVVATDVSGIPELVQHRKTGYLIKSESPEDLVQTLLTIWSDYSAAKLIGKNARRHIEVCFNNQLWIKECAKHLKQVLPQNEAN